MITQYLCEQIPDCEAAADNGDGSYLLDFLNGESRLATQEEIAAAQAQQDYDQAPTVTAWQFMQALVQFGLYTQIEAAVVGLNNPLATIGWQRAPTFHRYNPLVVAVAAAAGISSNQVDDVFALAQTL